MVSQPEDEPRVFVSPLYFRLTATFGLGLAALAGYPLLQIPVQTAGQWLYLALLAVLAAACLLAWLYLNADRARKLAIWPRTHRLFAWLLGGLVLAASLAGWVATAQVRWAWAVLPQMTWLALTALFLFVLVFTGQPRSKLIGVVGRTVVVMGFVLATYLALDLILRAVPALVPESAWRHLRDPGLRLRAYYSFFDQPVAMGYRYRPNRSEWVPCRNTGLPPFRIRMITDENGFRNTPPLANHYQFVATGDSFTAGDFVDDPWPGLVKDRTGLPALNLGIRGWGPQAQVEAVKAFGLPHNPTWVIVGYYEGNDLRDAAVYEEVRGSGLDWVAWSRSVVPPQPMDSWLAWQSLRYGLHDFAAQILGAGNESASSSRRFPLEINVGGQTASLSFYDDQTSALSASQADIEASINYALTEAALRELKRASDAQGSRVLLAYLPAKEHVYLPLIDDDEALATVLAGAGQMALGEDGYLYVSDMPVEPQALLAHLDDQRKAMEALADRLDIGFVDLTPVFQAETARGRALYFPINAHWNQEGQQLAAERIADYVLKDGQ